MVHVLSSIERRAWLAMGAAALVAPSLGSAAGRPKRVETPAAPRVRLFGQDFAGATRTSMRTAMGQAGATALREDDRYLADLYDARGLLDHATQLALTYEPGEVATARLGSAVYDLSRGWVDPTFVGDVAGMVRRAYGPPSRVAGSVDLGNYEAIWTMPASVGIEVWRIWPNSEVHLGLYNRPVHQRIRAYIAEQNRARQTEDDKRQSRAF